jgi:hypothetical protein
MAWFKINRQYVTNKTFEALLQKPWNETDEDGASYCDPDDELADAIITLVQLQSKALSKLGLPDEVIAKIQVDGIHTSVRLLNLGPEPFGKQPRVVLPRTESINPFTKVDRK